MNGLRPIVEFMTWNFAVLALDQILNTASKMLAMSGGQISCPIVFRGGNASAGQLGAQHSTAFESYYANIPGLKLFPHLPHTMPRVCLNRQSVRRRPGDVYGK